MSEHASSKSFYHNLDWSSHRGASGDGSDDRAMAAIE